MMGDPPDIFFTDLNAYQALHLGDAVGISAKKAHKAAMLQTERSAENGDNRSMDRMSPTITNQVLFTDIGALQGLHLGGMICHPHRHHVLMKDQEQHDAAAAAAVPSKEDETHQEAPPSPTRLATLRNWLTKRISSAEDHHHNGASSPCMMSDDERRAQELEETMELWGFE